MVNAVGSVTVGDGPWFWAAPFEVDGEFGGRGLPPSFTPDMLQARLKGGPDATSSENTTLVVVVTDAVLTKPQAKRLAMIAQTGMARAIYPVHAPLDGDVVFAAATGKKPIDPLFGLTELGMVAANMVARAIARGVHVAAALPFPGALPAWEGSLRLGRTPKDHRRVSCSGADRERCGGRRRDRLGLALDHLLDEIVGRGRRARRAAPAADVIVTFDPSA